MSVVLDNSIALTWCFEDERTPATQALLRRVARTGALAPALFPIEAMNALVVAERRNRIDAAKRAVYASFLRRLPIALDTDTTSQVWDATAALAVQFRLTVYDATYLELAQRRRLPLATLDRPLRTAAAALGIEALGLATG